jgi:hypothetical protein
MLIWVLAGLPLELGDEEAVRERLMCERERKSLVCARVVNDVGGQTCVCRETRRCK